MKLYISGPMTGIPDYNYPLFEEVVQAFRDQGVKVFSPHEIDGGEQVPTVCPAHPQRGTIGADETCCTTFAGIRQKAKEIIKPWQYYMTKAIQLQMQCNAWAGLAGWPRSKGAKREFDLAVDLQHELFIVRYSTPRGGYYLEEL
jgi:hypothetical protein